MLAQLGCYASSRSARSALVHSLYSGSKKGALYDPGDLSTLFQDAAGTVAVTAADEPVGRVLDVSGNAAHATQATAAARMLYRSANDGSIEADRVDDNLEILDLAPLTGETWTFFWAYPEAYTTEAALLVTFVLSSGSTIYTGLGQSGSSSTIVSFNVTTDSFRTDSATASFATRGDFHAALAASNYCVLQSTMGVGSAAKTVIGRGPVGNFYCPKRWTVFGAVRGVLTTDQLTLLEEYLASRS